MYEVMTNVYGNHNKADKDSVVILFDRVKVNGVAWDAGIRNGDQLIEIDGKTIKNTIQAQYILNEFDYGQYASYKYERDGKIYSTKVFVKKLVQFDWLASCLSALFWMLIGFIVLTSKPDGRIHRLFYLWGVMTVLSSLMVHLPIYGEYDKFLNEYGWAAYLVIFFWLIGMTFSPFVINYFLWNFPNTFNFAKKKWVKRTVFIIPSIFFLTFFTVFVLVFNGVLEHQVIFRVNLYYYLSNAAFVAAIIALIVQYIKIKSKEKRKPILLMIIALCFGGVIAVYVNLLAPAISDTLFNSPEYYTPIILIVLVPLIFAYSIFKYQLMDVSVVVKNTIVYGTATVTVAAIYFFVIYVAGHSISSFFGVENQGIIAGVFFIIFALVFQSTKDRFQNFLTKRFYPEQFAYQNVLIELSNELAIVAGLEKILALMKHTFVDALKINTFGILVRDKEGNLALVDSVGMNPEKCVISESRLIQFLKDKFLITKYPSIEQADFKTVFKDEVAERFNLRRNFYYNSDDGKIKSCWLAFVRS